MGSPAAERGREVRQRLLAAAVELIPERGWTAVSTRVLAERAGVTPSVVHYHFPSMSELLNEAVLTLMRQVLAATEEQIDPAGDPASTIRAVVTSVAEHTGDDPASLVFLEAFLAATRDAGLRERIGAELEGFRRRIGELLDANGVPEPEATAAVLAASIDGLLLHRALAEGPDTRAVIDVLGRLVPGEERR